MRKVVIGFLFLLLLIAGGFFVAIQFLLTPEYISTQVQQAVKKATGRELLLRQPPRLSYWPKLSVELRDVSLSNPPQMQAGVFTKMDAMRVQVDVVALFSRRLQIEEVSLESPEITLLVDKNGQASWSLTGGSRDEATGRANDTTSGPGRSNPIEDLSLAPISIRGGRIRYSDQRKGTEFSASDVNVTITLPNLEGALKVEGSLLWNDKPVELTLFVENPQRISQNGSIAALVLESELLEANYTGELSLQNGFELTGRVDTATPSIRKLASWAGSPIAEGNGLEQFEASSGLAIRTSTISLKGGKYSLDGMNAEGNLNIDVSGKIPFVSGNLNADKIDVNAYLPPETKSTDNNTQTGSSGNQNASGWSDEKIDFSGLNVVNAKLSIGTSNILYRDITIGRTQVNASLEGGTLNASLSEMGFYNGIAKGEIRVSSTNSSIAGRLNASGLDGNRLLADFADFNRITGKTDLNINFSASGRSQKEFVSALNGVVGFKFEDGALKGINIPRMVRSVQSNILGGWQSAPEEKTDFSVLQANFDISNGIASNSDLLMASPLMRVTGNGQANMPNQSVDYRVEPKVVGTLIGQGGGNELTGLQVPVIIRGPWSNPKIYPDIKGILENPQSAFDALSKLTGKDVGIDIDKERKKVEEKITEEVQNAISDVIPKETEELLGEDANKLLEEQGKSLLKGLFGGNE